MEAPPIRSIRERVLRTMGRYGFVGLICAALNLAILYVGHGVLGLHYVTALFGTCLLTIPLSYFLHRRFSFQVQSAPNGAQFLRFCAAQFSQFSIGLGLMIVCVEVLDLPVMLAMISVTAAQFLYGFTVSSTWVFRFFHNKRVKGSIAHPEP